MMKKYLLLLFLFVSFQASSLIDDTQLNGTKWEGAELGIYVGKAGLSTPKYQDSLLLFDCGMDFDRSFFRSWEGDTPRKDSVTRSSLHLSKSTDKKALKVWKKLDLDQMDGLASLVEEFPTIVANIRFVLESDSTFSFIPFALKYHVDYNRLLIDLNVVDENTITLMNRRREPVKLRRVYREGMSDKERAQALDGADDFFYWTEKKMFCLGMKTKGPILVLRAPFERSKDGKTIRLILRKMDVKSTATSISGKSLERVADLRAKGALLAIGVDYLLEQELKSIDEVLVELGGKPKTYFMEDDTLFVDLSDIMKHGVSPKEEDRLSVCETYDNYDIILALKKMDEMVPQAGLLSKFDRLSTNEPLVVAPQDTAEVMATIRKYRDLLPSDATPVIDERNCLIVVAEKVPAAVDNSQIQDLYVSTTYLTTSMDIVFNEAGTKNFAALTKANVSKRVAMMLNHQLLTAPYVHSEIDGGRVSVVSSSSLADLVKTAIKIKVAMAVDGR